MCVLKATKKPVVAMKKPGIYQARYYRLYKNSRILGSLLHKRLPEFVSEKNYKNFIITFLKKSPLQNRRKKRIFNKFSGWFILKNVIRKIFSTFLRNYNTLEAHLIAASIHYSMYNNTFHLNILVLHYLLRVNFLTVLLVS